jgi:hypothetical protein
MAGSRLAQFVAGFVSMPGDLLQLTTDLIKDNKEAFAFAAAGDLPTSVDNMTPGNPFIRALAQLPVAPGVANHSIIAVQGDGPMEKGNDGIVEYTSAHLEGVDSELVVRAGHSCQSDPHVIQEIRRVLLLHAAAESCRQEPQTR